MSKIQKVAVFGAGGNLGSPITSALVSAGFNVTIITRSDSTSTFKEGIPVVRTDYSVPALTAALQGYDAVVSAVGIAGVQKQKDMMDAAEAAGVYLFVLSDFGYGPGHKRIPEFEPLGKPRQEIVAYAEKKAAANTRFAWSAIAIGNPIDWALKKLPLLGFDVAHRTATIYDSGTERFTGTTLAGISNAVVGILNHPKEAANKQLHVRSIETCQNELLEAFEQVTDEKWPVVHQSANDLLIRGREKLAKGDGGWVLDLIIGQLYEEGKGRSIVVTADHADNDLLGMPEENVHAMVRSIILSTTGSD